MLEANEQSVGSTGNGHTTSTDIQADMDVTETVVAKMKKVKAALSEITSVQKQVLAIKTKIEDHQTVVATKSAHIEDARKHGDEVMSELDRELATARQLTAEAEGQKTRAQAVADELVKILVEVETRKNTVNAHAEEVSGALDEAEESADKVKVLAERSATIEKRLAEYEKGMTEIQDRGKSRLAELDDQGKILLKTIEGLLPGAASAGLAHGFAERRETFLQPRRNWEKVFVGSLIGIAVLAIGNWLMFHEATHVWSDTLLMWLARLPMAAPLILLAYHAAHEAALGKRLEEAYGYKVAMASSFMGFHKQLSEVGTDIATNALAKLYDNTLATIADPPGRIYDKHNLVATPGDLVAQVAKTVKEVLETSIPGKQG